MPVPVPLLVMVESENRSFSLITLFTLDSVRATLGTLFGPTLLQHLLLLPPTPPGDNAAAMSGRGVNSPAPKRASLPASWNGLPPSSSAVVVGAQLDGFRNPASTKDRTATVCSLSMVV